VSGKPILPILYALKIAVEATDTEDENVLLDVEASRPFGSFHAGDTVWPQGLQPDGLVNVHPYMYNAHLTVKLVQHVIYESTHDDHPVLYHNLNVVLQHPYSE
jgi:hypothetical protein